jgi:ribosome biogenesis GTPase A
VILEVRDSRIVTATAHPDVSTWSAGVGRIIVVTKSDLVPKQVTGDWRRAGLDVWNEYEGDENQRRQKLAARGVENDGTEGGGRTRVVCLDLKKDNTRQLKKHIFQLGKYVNERR